MDNAATKQLCMDLIKADTEQDIIKILRRAGYWDKPDAWRYYGDTKNNYSTIGNQQSRPEAALVEKIVNSIDARLTNECCVRDIDPEGIDAPKSIREGVARFFEDNPNSPTAGLVREWLDEKRRTVARGITLAATGYKPREGSGRPCFTISDCGEGQMPQMMPKTLLSLDSDNKQKITFVQGKFNMGGTGALTFCGFHNLQLILTRRNPKLIKGKVDDLRDLHWGFTIVRREYPEGVRSSFYTYLAPIDCDSKPNKGDVLSYESNSMPIFPEGNKPYKIESEWGTLIKMYEYKATGFKSHILMPDGLLSRIDLLLPTLALPARFHECRDYRGHSGSPETTVTGLNVRLGDDRKDNLEDNFPITDLMTIGGEQMPVTIYAFKKGKAKSYRKSEGIIFTVNGQTHGHMTIDFFRRQNTKCSYLRDSLLVVVDCGKLSGRAIEDLFMNSRDRLSGDELRIDIEKNLEEILRTNEILRSLKNRRQQEQRDAKIDDSKPLKDVLQSMIKKSPTLSQLFLHGTRISNPFKTVEVKQKDEPYLGEKHPSYFKFKGSDYGCVLNRNCHINMRARITFETDVENNYFGREIDTGSFALLKRGEDNQYPYDDFILKMQNGIATLTIILPSDCQGGDALSFEAVVNDRTLLEPFKNSFNIKVLAEAKLRKSRPGKRRKPAGKDKGTDRDLPLGLDLPSWTEVYENPKEGQKGWSDIDHPFNKYTALVIKADGSAAEDSEDDAGQESYDFYINMDNIYLKNEQKNTKGDPVTMNFCFIWGLVLMGISMIHDDIQERKQATRDENGESVESEGMHIEDKVEIFSKAVAPVLLPMIENLGGIDEIEDFVDNTTGAAA